MLDLLNGLEVIHANKIVHEDLKPENVFIKDCFKIGDFGLSKKINEEFRTRGGTQYYNAPEKYEGEKPDYPSDIYALGVILFEILYGEHPYISQN